MLEEFATLDPQYTLMAAIPGGFFAMLISAGWFSTPLLAIYPFL